MALTGTLVHAAHGLFAQGLARVAMIAAGVVVGAQIGARLSTRVGGKWIMRCLAVVMLFVGVRLIVARFCRKFCGRVFFNLMVDQGENHQVGEWIFLVHRGINKFARHGFGSLDG